MQQQLVAWEDGCELGLPPQAFNQTLHVTSPIPEYIRNLTRDEEYSCQIPKEDENHANTEDPLLQVVDSTINSINLERSGQEKVESTAERQVPHTASACPPSPYQDTSTVSGNTVPTTFKQKTKGTKPSVKASIHYPTPKSGKVGKKILDKGLYYLPLLVETKIS